MRGVKSMSDGIYTSDPINAVSIAIGAASASATIPPGSELLALMSSGNCHFRMGKGAQTALATDPMLGSSNGLFILRVPPSADTIACIQDGSSTGNLSVSRVFCG